MILGYNLLGGYGITTTLDHIHMALGGFPPRMVANKAI